MSEARREGLKLIEEKKGRVGEGAPSDVHRPWRLGRDPGHRHPEALEKDIT
jgi:hypothetical protein